jgi:ribokinase
MRVGVVGHVEQVDFAVVETLPDAGAVVHASHWFRAAGGGGAVAAVQLRKLAGEAALLTALGSDGVADQLHRELTGHGVTVRAALRPGPHRRGFVHLETATGERTITIMGSRIAPRGDDPLPWDDLGDYEAVYFTAGDA